jgi:hypothetical protein
MTETTPLWCRKSLIAGAALFLVFIALLVVEQRPAYCKEGIGFWSPAWQSCTSQHFLDPYSLSHVLHGILLYGALWPLRAKISLHWRLIIALVVEIGWELLENSPWVIERYRQDTASLDYTGDSILNSFGDALTMIIGFIFASRFSWKASVALFVVFELWALYLAKDNLILNVLMLLFPLEAVKQWQLGN